LLCLVQEVPKGPQQPGLAVFLQRSRHSCGHSNLSLSQEEKHSLGLQAGEGSGAQGDIGGPGAVNYSPMGSRCLSGGT